MHWAGCRVNVIYYSIIDAPLAGDTHKQAPLLLYFDEKRRTDDWEIA